MVLIKYKPITTSQRFLVTLDNSELCKKKPLKKLVSKIKRTGGRNNQGKVVIRGRSGGGKRSYRIIDFCRRNQGLCIVLRIEYDPNRTANIALIQNRFGDYFYILAPKNLKVGNKVDSSFNASVKLGNCLPLKKIPVGTQVHNIEYKPGKGGQLARSAGSFAILTSKQNDKIYLRLRSSEVIIINSSCLASIGQVSNSDVRNLKFGKAGRMRWLGRAPKVRGVAMNPVDHPHGGGEGKTSGGRHPVNKNGRCAKGFRTRKNKRTDMFIIKSRHKEN